MKLTEEQNNIVEFSKKMRRNEILKINACAGSGKTSTLIEIALANPNSSFLYLAFNKAIVEESKKKFPENVKLKTIHSLAFSNIIAPRKYKVVNNFSIFDYMDFLNIEDYQIALSFEAHFSKFLNSDEKLENAHFYVSQIFNMARNRKIPYTHNLYLKEYELKEEKDDLSSFDFIMLDEAQDTNAVTLSIFLHNNCRKILVGDTFQNIYAFRETVNALSSKLVQEDYKFNLTYSFRSSQKILDKAYFFLQKYTIDGENPMRMRSAFQRAEENKTKVFLTRLNSSIIEIIHSTLKKSEKNRFCLLKEPNSLLESSIAVYYFLKKDFDRLPKAFSWLKKFTGENDLLQYIENGNDLEMKKSFENATNYGSGLFTILEEARRIYKREDNFNEYLINAHLSKGLEFTETTLFNDFSSLSSILQNLNNADSLNEKEMFLNTLIQEKNLYYVALTRAKEKVFDRSENHNEWIKYVTKINALANENHIFRMR